MFKWFFRCPFILTGVIFLFSCSPANNKPVLIAFSADSTAIVFSGVNRAGLFKVRGIPNIDTAYQQVLSVMETPGEDDSTSMELPFPGKLRFTDSSVVFDPLTPFVSGKSYLVVSYMNVKFANTEMVLSEKLNSRLKPDQVVLTR
jgi:hypothetical protein